MNDAEIRLQVKLDDSSAIKSVDNLSAKADKLSQSFSKAGKTLTVGLTLPLAGLVGTGLKYNAEMEQYQAGLETMLGSSEKASSTLADLKKMASKTPFETTDLIKASQTMLAFGMSSEKTREALSMLGDVSMGNKDKLSSLTLAFAQVQSTGRLMGQDLLQMVGQGFNPLQIISEQTGRSMKDLKSDMEKGAISADMVTEAFKVATSEGGRFYGAMDKQSTTVSGKLSTLKDDFNTATGELTKALLPALSDLVGWLSKISASFSKLSDKQKKNVLIVIGIVGALGPMILLIGKLIKVFGTAVKIIKGVSTAMSFLNAVLVANPVGAIIIGIVALIAIFVLLYTKCEWFRNGVQVIFKALIGFFTTIYEAIKSVIMAVWDFIKPAVELWIAGVKMYVAVVSAIIKTIIDVFVWIVGFIWELIKLYVGFWVGVIQFFVNTVKTVIGAIVGVFRSVFDFVWGIIKSVIDKISNAFNVVGETIKTVFTAVRDAIANVFQALGGIIKAPINAIINSINKVLKKINDIEIPSWVPGLGGKHTNFSTIPTLQTGTNYVPQTGLAYLHQGEAVVPKKYNPSAGGFGSGMTIVLQQPDIIMDGNKVGRATIPYITKTVKLSGGNV